MKQKNLRPINGKPLICYTIEAAKKAEMLTEVYVNSESDSIEDVTCADRVKFYRRDALLLLIQQHQISLTMILLREPKPTFNSFKIKTDSTFKVK